MTIRQALLYLWASPASLLGLTCMMAACTVGRVRVAIVDGILEVHGEGIDLLLRRGTLLEGGASAMTLGHVVLGRDQDCLDWTRDHEHVHVRQCERWGPLFIPAYLLASLIAQLCGQDPYRDNPFEREAFERFG